MEKGFFQNDMREVALLSGNFMPKSRHRKRKQE